MSFSNVFAHKDNETADLGASYALILVLTHDIE